MAHERARSGSMDKPNLNQPTVPQRDDEIFDVVDLADQVVGRQTRRLVHARNLLHRAVHVIVLDPAGRVFLQKRSMAKDSWPGRWDSSCSGHLDAGEDYLPAAIRELREEIGVLANPEELVFQLKLSPRAETGWEFVSVFTLRYAGEVLTNPAEIERGEWFEAAALTKWMSERPDDFTSTLKIHWPRIFAALPGH